MNGSDELSTAANPNVARKLWRLIPKTEKRQLPLIGLSLLVGSLLEVVGVGLLVPLVNLLAGAVQSSDASLLRPVFDLFDASSQTQMLTVGLLLVGLVVLTKNTYLLFASYFQNSYIIKIRSSLARRIFGQYLHRDYSFHIATNSSILSKNLIVEVDLVSFNVIAPLLTVVIEVSTALGIFSLLLYVQPLASLVLLSFFVLCSIVYIKMFSPYLQHFGDVRSELRGDVFKMVSEAFGGIKEVKVLGKEKYFEDKFAKNNFDYARVTTRIETVQRVPAYLVELVAVLGLLLVVSVLLLQGNEGSGMISGLGLFVGSSFRFVPALNRILSSVQVLKLGRAPIDIVFKAIGDDSTARNAKETIRFEKKLEFRDVSFVYHSQSEPVLRNVSLSVSIGESVGVVGTSGAGKTTLVDLLLGLLTPTSGQVLVDGLEVDLARYSWQSVVGYVPQEIYLLDDTIRNNIALGIPAREISDSQISRCIEIARLSDFVASLPEGLNTVIGEDGVRLSGGQRQRIGIARAIYHRPSLLVLDEATSALDLETEREFVETLEALHKSLTMIVVSHRMTTLKYCDRLIRLSGGQLVSE